MLKEDTVVTVGVFNKIRPGIEGKPIFKIKDVFYY